LTNRIVKVSRDSNTFEGWVLYSLEKQEPAVAIESPCVNFSFSKPIDVTFVLGMFIYENITIKCGLRDFERADRAVLIFTIGDETICATSVMLSKNSFAIPMNMDCSQARVVKGGLGQGFEDWLYSLESLTWD
jgi:hypothetical protein